MAKKKKAEESDADGKASHDNPLNEGSGAAGDPDEPDYVFAIAEDDIDDDTGIDIDKLDSEKLDNVRLAVKKCYEEAMAFIDKMEDPKTLEAIKTGEYVHKKQKKCRSMGPEFWENLPEKKQKKIVKRSRNELITVMRMLKLKVPGLIFKPKIQKLCTAFRESLTLDYAKRYCKLLKKAGVSKEDALARLEKDGLPMKGAKKAYRGLLAKGFFGAAAVTLVAYQVTTFAVSVPMAIESDMEQMGKLASGQIEPAMCLNPMAHVTKNIPLDTIGKAIIVGGVVAAGVSYAVSSTEKRYTKPYKKMMKMLTRAEKEVVQFAFKEGGCCCC